MNYKDTIKLMKSDDWVDRFRAEYEQTRLRVSKLDVLIFKYQNNKLDFTPNCSLRLLKTQSKVMHKYLRILEKRANIEGIKLTDK